MKCRYCNIALAPLRSLTDGEFCCDEHRKAHSELKAGEAVSCPPPQGGLIPLVTRVESASPEPSALPLKQPAPLEFRPKTMAAPAFCTSVQACGKKSWLRLPDHLLALKFGTQLFNTPINTPSAAVTESPAAMEFAAAPV